MRDAVTARPRTFGDGIADHADRNTFVLGQLLPNHAIELELHDVRATGCRGSGRLITR